MPLLFESFVGNYLKQKAQHPVTIKLTASSEWLVIHNGERRFRLEPDFLMENNNQKYVMDVMNKKSRDSLAVERVLINITVTTLNEQIELPL